MNESEKVEKVVAGHRFVQQSPAHGCLVQLLEAQTQAEDGTLTKAILRKTARQIEASVSWQVWRRDGCRCRYCGRDNVPLTVDHLVRWEEGGPSTEENLVSSCKKCNQSQGDQP